MKKQVFYLFILALLTFLASCNPKVLTTTVSEDTLSIYRVKYDYEREKFETPDQGVSVVIEVAHDTTWTAMFDVTKRINSILDYIPPKPIIDFVPKRISGFRIQIYRGRNRAKAEKARSVSFGLFPRHRPYLIHEVPTYRVQVGDFINEQECRPIYRVLRKEFPTALIVPSIVNIVVEK